MSKPIAKGGAVTAWACCHNPTRLGHKPDCPHQRSHFAAASPLPEEPPELKEALDAWLESAIDDLQARAMDIAVMESPKSYMMLQHREAAAKRLRDARAALVALYAEKEAELASARAWNDKLARPLAEAKAQVASLSCQLEQSRSTRDEPRRVNDKHHEPASLPTTGEGDAKRLACILCELRAVDILWDPIPASRKHDEIYKRHDEFLCAIQAKYEPSWKAP